MYMNVQASLKETCSSSIISKSTLPPDSCPLSFLFSFSSVRLSFLSKFSFRLIEIERWRADNTDRIHSGFFSLSFHFYAFQFIDCVRVNRIEQQQTLIQRFELENGWGSSGRERENDNKTRRTGAYTLGLSFFLPELSVFSSMTRSMSLIHSIKD